MAVEYISWSKSSQKNINGPDQQSDVHQTVPLRPEKTIEVKTQIVWHDVS